VDHAVSPLSAVLGVSAPGRGAGVCANVDFQTPKRLVEDAVAAGGGQRPPTPTRARPERLA
jgi:hypothetical protein